MSTNKKTSLPLIADCTGCGVCCFHMGYPAFILPREPMTDQEIDANNLLLEKIKKDPKLRADLKAGHAGESYWHELPSDLKKEWLEFVEGYTLPDYGDTPETFDGPCFWFDMETRMCKNHLHRPNVCRDFETGNAECLEWRRYYKDKIITD